MNEPAPFGVDSTGVSAADSEVDSLLGGGRLSERIRTSQDGYVPPPERVEPVRPPGADVSLAAATQLEIQSGEVRFLVPFNGSWPNEYWMRAFRQAHSTWPADLVEPRIDEGRGLQLGPLAAADLEETVRALKALVGSANRIYAEEIEPEIRRQRDEAFRREQEEIRLQAEVESKLKSLLG